MTEGPVSPPCPLAGREAPSLWPVAADKQEKVNHAQGGSSQASASGWQWRVRQEQGGGKEESRRSLYPPGVWCVCVCEDRRVRQAPRSPSAGHTAQVRAGPGSLGPAARAGLCQALHKLTLGGTGAGVGAEPGGSRGGGGAARVKNADAEDNELSQAEATHLVPATLY